MWEIKLKMVNKRKAMAVIMVLCLVSVIKIPLKPCSSQTDTVVRADPSLILDIPPSQNFNLTIKIENVNFLYGFDISVRWDPSVLGYVDHITKVPVEDYPDGVLYEPFLKIKDEVNETKGEIWIVYSSIYPAPVFNGSGIVLEITFHVKAWGVTEITLKTDLADQNAQAITHETINALFINQPPPSARLTAPKIKNSSLTPGTSFQICIGGEGLFRLRILRLWFTYDTSILETQDVTVNPAFTETKIDVEEETGEIYVSANTTTPIDGDACLITITFNVVGIGKSTLDIKDAELIYWYYNGQILYQQYEAEDGLFDNIPPLPGEIMLAPTRIFRPDLKPGMSFSLDVKITAENLYGYQFNLTYDTNILSCISILIVPVHNETNFVPQVTINDESGWVWVDVNYFSPAEPLNLDNETVVKIYFLIQNYGATPINLTKTMLLDYSGNPIGHSVGHSWFGTLTADIAIKNIEVSPRMVYPGRIVNITVTIVNEGYFDATFNLSIYYGTLLIYTGELNLPVNSTLVTSILWNTTGLEPCNNHTIRGEVSPLPYEIDLDDNTYVDGYVKIKLIGDINGDDVVDIYDMVEAGRSYGTKEGDADYNPEADLAAPYGVIDIYDIVTLAYNYGNSC